MTARHSKLRLVSEDERSKDITEAVILGGHGQQYLPLDDIRSFGITVVVTRHVTGECFRACLQATSPKLVLDVRALPRLDFDDYSRQIAFEDFRALGARYAMSTLGEERDGGGLKVLAQLEKAGVSRSSVEQEMTVLLVDDEEEAQALRRSLVETLEAAGWACPRIAVKTP